MSALGTWRMAWTMVLFSSDTIAIAGCRLAWSVSVAFSVSESSELRAPSSVTSSHRVCMCVFVRLWTVVLVCGRCRVQTPRPSRGGQSPRRGLVADV
ncbi:hypothetical protein QBC39DRAFT_350801 [Podospora conica]|nr:hypothetical protein QBC39DRAFT_350801 [Schizothecium conicum]